MKRFIERFGHRSIDSIRAVEVEQYKRSRLLDDKAAKETVGKEIRRLKAAFNRGVEWKELDVNPLASVKAPRGVRSVAVKFYDRAAMRRLYRANPARAPLWLFMAHTGLRRGEIVGLEKSSVVAGRLLVESDPDESGEGRTKSGKWRGSQPICQVGASSHARPTRQCSQGHRIRLVQKGFRAGRHRRASSQAPPHLLRTYGDGRSSSPQSTATSWTRRLRDDREVLRTPHPGRGRWGGRNSQILVLTNNVKMIRRVHKELEIPPTSIKVLWPRSPEAAQHPKCQRRVGIYLLN